MVPDPPPDRRGSRRGSRRRHGRYRRPRACGGRTRRRPRPVDVRRRQVRSRFRALRLRRSECPHRGRYPTRRARHLRQPQPLHPQGEPRGGLGPDLRLPADRLPGRAVHRVRAAGRIHRHGGGSIVGSVHAARGGPLARRPAGDGGRRDLDRRDPDDEGSSVLSSLLCGHLQRLANGAAHRQVRLRRHREPRASADRRADRGPAEALLGRARIRIHHPRSTSRQRPLPHRGGRARPVDHARARARLLGPRPSPSTGGRTTSTSSATTTTATPPSRSRHSRPARSTSAARTIRRNGGPPTTLRTSRTAGWSRS